MTNTNLLNEWVINGETVQRAFADVQTRRARWIQDTSLMAGAAAWGAGVAIVAAFAVSPERQWVATSIAVAALTPVALNLLGAGRWMITAGHQHNDRLSRDRAVMRRAEHLAIRALHI